MTEVTITDSTGAIDTGEHRLTVTNAKEIWLDDQTWDELDGPEDSSAQGDPTGKYEVEFEVEGTDGFNLTAQWWLNDYSIGPGSGLGQILERWGLIQDFAGQNGESLSLDDVFEVGSEFKAEVVDEPDGDYMAINDVSIAGHDDDDWPEDEQWGTTLTPLDEISASASGGSSEEDLSGTVYEVVAENEGEEKSAVMKTLAQKDGNLVAVFNDMVDDGEIQVQDGKVSL